MPIRFGGLTSVTVPNFVFIGQTIAEFWAFCHFPRWLPSAILDLFYACLDHQRSAVGGLYLCAKFGWNRPCSFEDMSFIVMRVCLKSAYSRAFWGVLGVKMREDGNFFSFIPLVMEWPWIDVLFMILWRSCNKSVVKPRITTVIIFAHWHVGDVRQK